MTEKKARIKLWTSSLLTFSLYLIPFLGLLLYLFISRYSDDIFGKNLNFLFLVKLFGLAACTLLEIALPICLVLTVATLYRKFYRRGDSNIKQSLKKAIIPSVSFALIGLIWIGFIMPIVNLHFGAILYAVRIKRPNEALEIPDLKLFKNYRDMLNLFEITTAADSVKGNLDTVRSDLIKYIKSNPNNLIVQRFLLSDTIKKLNITTKEIENTQVKDSTFVVHNDIHSLRAWKYQTLAQIDELYANYNILSIQKDKIYGYPFYLLITYFMGMFIGILNRKNRYLIIMAVGIYFTIVPFLYYTSVRFADLSTFGKISPFCGQFYPLSIFAVVTLLLFLYANKTTTGSDNSYIP